MKNYQVKMSTHEFNDYVHRLIRQREHENILERYSQEELLSLAEKMTDDLEQWRDKESIYPADWELLLASINRKLAGDVDPKADTLLQEGDWALHLSYRAVGTRSEHRYGTLTYKGEIIKGREVGEERDTDLGRLRYYGESPSEMSPWECTGWHLC